MKPRMWLVSAIFVFFFESILPAAPLEFLGSSVFQSGAPVTQFTEPEATWAFSFTIDSNLSPSQVTDVGFDVTFSNFNYTLNGVAVNITPEIRFFLADFGGMLDINFVQGPAEDMDPVTGLAFCGPSIFTGSTSAPTLQAGTYLSDGGVFWSGSSPVQSLSGTVVTGEDTSGVPEPNTIFEILGAGVCFMASGIMRRLRRRA